MISKEMQSSQLVERGIGASHQGVCVGGGTVHSKIHQGVGSKTEHIQLAVLTITNYFQISRFLAIVKNI